MQQTKGAQDRGSVLPDGASEHEFWRKSRFKSCLQQLAKLTYKPKSSLFINDAKIKAHITHCAGK